MTDPTQSPITLFPDDTDPPPPIARPSMRFMLSHPAHWMALGFGSGLSRIAPGTAGTAWAWITFILLAPWMNDLRWGLLIGAMAGDAGGCGWPGTGVWPVSFF